MSLVPLRARPLSIALAVVIAAVALSACSSSPTATKSADCTPAHPDVKTLTAGTLTVGVTDLPPLISTTGDKGYSGVDADIMDGFGKYECLKIAPVAGSVSALVTGVQQGRWDTALGGFYRTKARSEVLLLSDPTYLDKLVIVSKKKYSTFDDLVGLKVGTADGTGYTEDIKKIYGADTMSYPSELNLSQDLDAGRIDAAIDTANQAPAVYNKDLYKFTPVEADPRVAYSATPGQGCFPVIKTNSSLVEALNDYLAKIKANGKLAAILEKHGLPGSAADTGAPMLL